MFRQLLALASKSHSAETARLEIFHRCYLSGGQWPSSHAHLARTEIELVVKLRANIMTDQSEYVSHTAKTLKVKIASKFRIRPVAIRWLLALASNSYSVATVGLENLAIDVIIRSWSASILPCSLGVVKTCCSSVSASQLYFQTLIDAFTDKNVSFSSMKCCYHVKICT